MMPCTRLRGALNGSAHSIASIRFTRAPTALGHPDARAVVTVGTQPQRRRMHGRCVLLDHLGVLDEPAGGEHDAGARAQVDRLAVLRRHYADNPAVVDRR